MTYTVRDITMFGKRGRLRVCPPSDERLSRAVSMTRMMSAKGIRSEGKRITVSLAGYRCLSAWRARAIVYKKWGVQVGVSPNSMAGWVAPGPAWEAGHRVYFLT